MSNSVGWFLYNRDLRMQELVLTLNSLHAQSWNFHFLTDFLKLFREVFKFYQEEYFIF